MLIKELTVTNSKGFSIMFGNDFRLSEDFGITDLGASVNFLEGTTDGSYYQGTRIENRSFTFPFFIYNDFNNYNWRELQRSAAYRVFNPKCNPIRFDITTKGGNKYYFESNCETTPIFNYGWENTNSLFDLCQVDFVSTDPFIYQDKAETVILAGFESAFEFEFEMKDVEFGRKVQGGEAILENIGHVEVGMEVTFTARGTVTNPQIVNVLTNEFIKINHNLQPGETIILNTERRNKRVTLIGVDGQETNIFNKIDLGSTFLQVEPGENKFTYNTDAGQDLVTIQLKFSPKYLGL